MISFWRWTWAAVAICSFTALASGQEFEKFLTEEAKEELAAYKEDIQGIRQKAEEQIKARRDKMIAMLTKLQDKLTKAGDLDGALAVREQVRAAKHDADFQTLKPAKDPGNMTSFRDQAEKVFYFEIVGSNDGSLYGTDIYTSDSDLSTAAVHAGVCQIGAPAIVKVTMLNYDGSHESSTRNGITSSSWGSYGGSYKVEKIR